MNEKRLKESLHLGHKKTFGSWKLIWLDADMKIRLADVSEKTASALIASGMPVEG